jgi:hypothetical protein
LLPRRQAHYFTFLTERTLDYRRPPFLFNGQILQLQPPRGTPPASTRRRLLDLAAVRSLATPGMLSGRPDVADFVRDAGLVARPRIGSLSVYDNPHALPRAFVVYRTIPAPEAATLLGLISEPTFDPLVASYVEGGPTFAAGAADAPRGVPAAITVDEDEAVEVEATLERPGLVVLADAYFPGWRATVDGASAPVLPTNHLFRGVAAPAGSHRIRFTYEPLSVYVGAVASVVGWLAIAALYLLDARGRKTRARTRSSPASRSPSAA